MVGDALADARDGGASDAQLAALRRAEVDGEVLIEVVREAARRSVACMRDAGLEARYDERTLAHGVVVPGYLVDEAVGADVDLQIEQCDAREFHWVSKAYQLQPSSVEAADQLVELRAPALRECLAANGVSTRAGDSGHELAARASRLTHDSGGAVSCLSEAGIEVW